MRGKGELGAVSPQRGRAVPHGRRAVTVTSESIHTAEGQCALRLVRLT